MNLKYTTMLTMKQACEYFTNSKKQRNRKHLAEVTQGDYCSGFSDKEYRKVKSVMKKASSKGRTFSHTKLWQSQNYSNKIHTMYYDNTFKTI